MTAEHHSHEAEIRAFLADPATHGGAAVEIVDTHCATVFLAGGLAYKVKRPVRYDYLDFSTLDRRRRMLERELELNGPGAPGIYREVVPITRGDGGGLALGGQGAAVEYALVMTRFPKSAELSEIARAGRLDAALARELGRSIAAYHDAAERRGENGAELIREIIDELVHAYAGMGRALGRALPGAFAAAAEAQFARRAAHLDRRGREGRVRRCHSDLHLGNLVMIEGRPVPFDALEFDERLGTCDTGYDIAFLVMDLWHRGLRAEANAMLNAYVEAGGDPGLLAGLPLFMGIRAGIRAMVDVQTARVTGAEGLRDEARGYLADAIGYMRPPGARLVAVGGLSGSGKSTVAAGLAPLLGAAPGALLLASDRTRKALMGVGPTTRLGPEGYAPEVSARVYARLHAGAGAALAAGHAALLDATYLHEGSRSDAAAVAARAQAPFTGLWLEAPAEVLLARVRARRGDVSDADEAVVRTQLAQADAPAGWRRIDASGAPEATLAAARAALGLG